MSTKTQIIQNYIAKIDSGDIDGAFTYVTDDYIYEAEPKPPVEVGYVAGGLDKSGYKEYYKKITEYHSDFKTTITSINDNGNKVVVKAKTKFSSSLPASGTTSAETHTEEAPFTAEYTFSGDKISHVKVTANPAVAAMYSGL